MQKTENFKYKATIDWIKIEITTFKDSNFNSIRNLFKAYFVEPINPSAGGATNQFKFKIHDLSSWRTLEDMISQANSTKSISAVKILAIEISFDAFSINNNKEELLEKVAEFYKFNQNPTSENHRLVGSKKYSPEDTGHLNSNIFKMDRGMSICIGNQDTDSISQRIYYKTMDNNANLPIELHRARYEVILRNENLPFHTIEEAKKYKFTSLAKWFKFRKTDETATGLAQLIPKAIKQLGKVNMKRRTGGGLIVNLWGTKADIALNQIAYESLRGLTIRLQKTRVMRKLRVTH